MNTMQIGDGKLPNAYWVSISEDYYYNSEGNYWDWASDRGEKCKGKTLKKFSTFAKAKAFSDTIELDEDYKGIHVRTLTIEDRISGQVFEKALYEHKEVRMIEEINHDTDFTEKEMAKRGVSFV